MGRAEDFLSLALIGLGAVKDSISNSKEIQIQQLDQHASTTAIDPYFLSIRELHL